MSTTMKALVTDGNKSASVKDVPIPKPGEGEILIKIHYVAQNPTDWKAMSAAPAGNVIGCDFAGTVEDTNGSHWREGQRVSGFVQGTTSKPPRGCFAECAIVEASLVYPIPDSITYQQAAVIPLAFATAVQAMYQRLALPEPSKAAKSAFPILINGGTSSVGKYAIQLAKMSNLFVIATGSSSNHELLTSLGADATIDYKDSNWPDKVREVSHDNLQHAFDCVSEGGTAQSITKAMSPSKGGHIAFLLPQPQSVKDETASINSKVKLESTIVYTVFQRELKYGVFDNCGDGETPEDKAHWEKWLGMLPDLLTGQKHGKTLKPNVIRELGGIDQIMTGFKEQQEGKVRAEKLVYKIV